MSHKYLAFSDSLYEYLLQVSLREPPVLRQLREETALHPFGGMQIAPDQGQFMGLLVELTGARSIVEVGVFTGYSSICMALALPPEGRIVALDCSEEFTAVARRYWALAGVSGKIDLRLGPGVLGLDRLLEEGRAGSVDLAFIDADKGNYDAYYERLLMLLRPGGLLLLDNVLWGGKVLDSATRDADTLAITALNAKLHADARVSLAMLPVADGLTLVRKR